MDAKYAKKGELICYAYPQAGSKYDQTMCANSLVQGSSYKVDQVIVFNFHTEVWLKGFGSPFNSVMFKRNKDGQR